MNFVGHIHLANHGLSSMAYPQSVVGEPGSTNRYFFGTALPDFATIGRFQLRHDPSDEAVALGVDVHHATDSAFHANPWFVDHSKVLNQDLQRKGINRGAARACGHVGVELLLDGHLLLSDRELAPRAQAALAMTKEQGLGLGELVAPTDRDRWTEHLARISSWTLPTDYDHPQAVAERLYRILRPRRRLAFGSEETKVVADALADIKPRLLDGVEQMVDEVMADVAKQAES